MLLSWIKIALALHQQGRGHPSKAGFIPSVVTVTATMVAGLVAFQNGGYEPHSFVADALDTKAPITGHHGGIRGEGNSLVLQHEHESSEEAVLKDFSKYVSSEHVGVGNEMKERMIELQSGQKSMIRDTGSGTTSHVYLESRVSPGVPPEKFTYRDITVQASVHREIVSTLAAGTRGYWTATDKQTQKTRTSRKSLYEVAKEQSSSVSTSIEHAMSAGASFPFKGISFSGEASSSFQMTVENGIRLSSKSATEYSTETESMFENTVTQHFTPYANPTDPDRVVYHEVWKIGDKEFKSKYLACTKVEFDALKSEVEVITWRVGADYQWYHLKAGNVVMSIPENNAPKYYGKGLVMWSPSLEYGQKWRFDDDDKHIVSAAGPGNFYLAVSENRQIGTIMIWNQKLEEGGQKWTVMADGTVRNDRGYCLAVSQDRYRNNQGLITWYCNSTTKWTWNKVD